MNFPADLKYSKEHEWVRIDGDKATIGISEFAQSELGDIVYVDIDSVGESFEANAIFGSVEAVKTVSDLYLPISGEILEVNDKLQDAPDLVNSDPYGCLLYTSPSPQTVLDLVCRLLLEKKKD